MIKIECIITKSMAENVLKKMVTLYVNKRVFIITLIFIPVTIFNCGTTRLEDILLPLLIVISCIFISSQIMRIITINKGLKGISERIRIINGDSDELPQTIFFEEDEWIVESEKKRLNFMYEDMKKYIFFDDQICILTKGNNLINFPMNPYSEKAKQIEKILVQKGHAKKIRWFL